MAKIAKDTGMTKTSAAAAVDSLIDGITRSLKKGDAVSFVGFGTFKTSQPQSAHRAQPADRRGDQDSEAPRAAVLRRQGTEAGGQVTLRERRGARVTPCTSRPPALRSLPHPPNHASPLR